MTILSNDIKSALKSEQSVTYFSWSNAANSEQSLGTVVQSMSLSLSWPFKSLLGPFGTIG